MVLFNPISKEKCLRICEDTEQSILHYEITNNYSSTILFLKSTVLGYMYQFGAWDDRAPVLDPRLPVVIDQPLESDGLQDGSVVASAPEWYHEELGSADRQATAISEQHPLIKGRTVSCLQRFTQHSATSGKPLCRTTYVEQTRFLRQVIDLLLWKD